MRPCLSWMVYASALSATSCVLAACNKTSDDVLGQASQPDAGTPAARDASVSQDSGAPRGPAGAAGKAGTVSAAHSAGASAAAGRGGTSGVAASSAGTPGHAGSGGAGTAAAAAGSNAAHVPSFTTRVLSSDHYAEGAAIDDVNGDGALDLIAGPQWYAGPAYELGGTLVQNPPTLGMDEYSLFFLTFSADLNGDGHVDVIGIADAGGGNGSGTPNAHWYENPGPDKLAEPWPKHPLFAGLVSNESPAFQNLVGDSANELVFMSDGKLGYATADAAWSFKAISGDKEWGGPYIHGLGVGDIDGDGLADIVERSGYWRQSTSATWEHHPFDFWLGATSGRANNWGGAQMAIYDIDGDGDNDILSALAAHQYGLAWFEHRPNETPEFVAHEILPTSAGADNTSQLHALVAVDINNDGLLDIVTGKRYYAHPSRSPDPGTDDPAKLLWFELKREPTGPTFTPHTIHEDSGAGCNFAARDLNNDGKIDIFTTNKRGTFLHLQD